MAASWTVDDIAWDRFDPCQVDPDLLAIVKAAALVEYNGATYTDYLHHVFHDDPDFKAKAVVWGEEEVQHGKALARWAALADPGFDFDAAFKRFTEGYVMPVAVEASVRGSRSGELIARCIVETGTSSFYTALAKAAREPVLRDICKRIAADEFRHYKLFYDALRPYLDAEGLGTFGRMRVAWGRLGETEDDELAYAYYAANRPEGEPYDRETCFAPYLRSVYPRIDVSLVRRGNSMILKAVGLTPNGWLNRILSHAAYRFLRYRARRVVAPA